MKKSIITALCSLFALFAMQTAFAQKIGVGVRGGLNFSSTGDLSGVSPSTSINKESITGYTFGAYAFFKFNPIFALQLEGNFTQLGYKFTSVNSIVAGSNAPISTVISEASFNYLQIPILLRIEKGFSDFRVWGNAGPYIGLSLGGNSKSIANTVGGIVGNTSTTQVSDLKSTDFGAMAGVGVGYKVGPGYITADARYAIGFTSTTSDIIASSAINADDFKNRSIMLSVGYLFEF
jgi:opacity protein-like surface antigen